MSLLRSITLIFALLVQAMPVQALMLRADAPAACTMGCCAAVSQSEVETCSCSEAPAPGKPLNVPPASGRELVPQVVWMILQEAPQVTRSPRALNDGTQQLRFRERALARQPQVRLSLLNCSWQN